MFTTGNCAHDRRSRDRVFANCAGTRVELTPVGPLPGT
jgi:hypothetical protein